MELTDLKIDRKSSHARNRRSPWPARLLALTLLAALTGLMWPAISRRLDAINLSEVRTLIVTETNPAAAAAVRGTAANGYVVAARRAALSSDIPGRIVELNVEEGTVVQRGDVVARLFADDFRAAYQQAVATVEAAEAEVARAVANRNVADAQVSEADRSLHRARALREEGRELAEFAAAELARMQTLVSAKIEGKRALQLAERDHEAAAARLTSLDAGVAAAAAAVQTAKQRLGAADQDIAARRSQRTAAAAARDQAKATLDKTDVRAPFDGIVVLKDAEIGEVVSPNAQGGSNARGAVCTMVDRASLEVQANVPENTLKSVAVGAPADVFLDAFPDDRYTGTVDRIWPTADRQKATVEVRVKLERLDDRLRPEMGVRVVFRSTDAAPTTTETAAAPRILVPNEAIVEVDGVSGAFVVERDVVRFTTVRLGESKGGRVSIEAGLRATQRIVLAPPTSLKDGNRVRLAQQ